MARNIVRLGGELQVNLLDPLPRPSAANGLLGGQFDAEATALSNGNFVVVYTNDAGGQGDYDILGVELTAAGAVVGGSTFRVDFDAGSQFTTDVAPRIGGGYAAVWQDTGNDGFNNNFISLAVIAPGTPGTPGPAEFKVEDTNGLVTLYGPSIATFANGTYIVGYTLSEQNLPNADVRVAIVKADGTGYTPGLGVPQTVSTPNDLYWHHSSESAVATFGNTAVVVYRDQLVNSATESDVASSDIRLSVVNTAGVVIDTEIVSDVANYLSAPDVVALKDGRFAIVWVDTTDDDLFGRIYDPVTGGFSGATFLVSNRASYQETPNVAALPDGGFIVTWTDSSETLGDTSEAIHGRRFDATGAFAGDEFLVNTATTGDQNSSALAVNAAGTIFVGWTDGAATNPASTDTDPARIQGQFFKPQTEVVDGTSAGDTIATYGLGETINGLAGDDAIDARGGSDLVNGGEGKDRLTGGLAADAFVFDARLKGTNADHITDFLPGTDSIRLAQSILKGLKVGDLNKKAFFAAKNADAAKDGKDRIIYDTKRGDVWFDKDGKGGSKAKLVATLDGSPDELSHTDFVVIA